MIIALHVHRLRTYGSSRLYRRRSREGTAPRILQGESGNRLSVLLTTQTTMSIVASELAGYSDDGHVHIPSSTCFI